MNFKAFHRYFFINLLFNYLKMTPTETKKAFIEPVFWFVTLSMIRVIFISLTIFKGATLATSIPPVRMLVLIFSGNLIAAIILTLLNRLLQIILRRVQ